MDLQLFAVIIIAILVAIVLIRGVYRFFFVKRRVVAVSDARAVAPPGSHDRRPGEILTTISAVFQNLQVGRRSGLLPAGVYSSSIRDIGRVHLMFHDLHRGVDHPFFSERLFNHCKG